MASPCPSPQQGAWELTLVGWGVRQVEKGAGEGSGLGAVCGITCHLKTPLPSPGRRISHAKAWGGRLLSSPAKTSLTDAQVFTESSQQPEK